MDIVEVWNMQSNTQQQTTFQLKNAGFFKVADNSFITTMSIIKIMKGGSEMNIKEAIEVLKKWGSLYDGTSELLTWDMNVFNEAIDTVIAEVEKHLPTDEKTVCPECLNQCTNEELKMFGGLCEECSVDFN
jgi:hypothetical protein